MSAAVELREVDVADEALLHRLWEIGNAVTDASRVLPVHWAWPAARSEWTTQDEWGHHALLAAWLDGEVVGYGDVYVPLRDNLHAAFTGCRVLPSHWRRGIGRTLYGELERRIREAGRTTVMSGTNAPLGGPSPGSQFAAAMGLSVALDEELKAVWLAQTAASWPALAEEAAAHHHDYRIETFEDRVPDDVVDGYCALMSSFVGEMPTGDLDLQQESWDASRVREHEARRRVAGSRLNAAVAVAADGEVVAFTDIFCHPETPRHGFQSGTIVAPPHRGHRLGLAIKLANHRAFYDRFPACEFLVTGNAGVNAPMNAINEQLGYRVVERGMELQKVL